MTVDARYRVDKILGKGAYGVVAEGLDLVTGKKVAIKKLLDLFAHPLSAKRSLRELKIHSFLKHPNILEVHDIMVVDKTEQTTFNEIYLVVDLMKVDLHFIISSGQPLTQDHYRYYIYQLVKALKYLHSANCMHRDLKPANCLSNAKCFLKVCDFGLARQHMAISYAAVVVTRYYRAPELFLDPLNYNESIDMWSVGMILTEFLCGKPWLRGISDSHQLNLILDTFGPPPEDLVAMYRYPKAQAYVHDYEYPAPRPLAEHFPEAEPELIDLLERMLAVDWRVRISAADALAHPFFAKIRKPASEIVADAEFPTFDFELADDLPIDVIRALIYNETLRFHPEEGTYDPKLYTNHFAEEIQGSDDWQILTAMDDSDWNTPHASQPLHRQNCEPNRPRVRDCAMDPELQRTLVQEAETPAGAYDPETPGGPPLPSLAAPPPAECVRTVLALRGGGDGDEEEGVDAEAGGADLVRGMTLSPLISAEEAEALMAWGEAVGIAEEPTRRKDIRSNTRLRFYSPRLADELYARLAPHLEPEIVVPGPGEPPRPSLGRGGAIGQDGTWRPTGLNPLFRLCRYEPGAHFAPHYDGQFVVDAETASFKTCMLYLNAVADGGATNFLDDSLPLFRDEERHIYRAPDEAVYLTLSPTSGCAIIFNHHIMHEGEQLGPEAGRKYILRTDVMYARVAGSSAVRDPDKRRALDLFNAAGNAEDAGDMAEAMRLYRIAFKLDPALGHA
ncbi:uncharacterized protein AMSG_12344 [Thecamonas trahens ATCC 50062]|uniref:Uncharacterized protein n=1 Tax=Thecamonas trahens ATCC 50062 TaxID=461836 RepID=A0A0L0DPW1_THETB|nr:hypothetical protein AMSG_12344 [Thecamonas trahens ATCC 50062]KNC54332.1 hypothetical protein AMSG_12344 [Thecamonas trahens ATCC 50062]|eukprot:XP_013753827.1 hypothetical protein AMSG_12344 [Thecamonas trahens ATCC 50062]